MKPSKAPDKVAGQLSRIYRLSYNKFYIDEIYLWFTHTIIFGIVAQAASWFDRNIIDGFLNGMASFTNVVSEKTKTLQSGQLQHYGIYMISGVLALFLIFIYWIS